MIILLNAVSLPSVDAFDIPQYSLMEKLADAGYDVWGIDFVNQGHAGKSTYYPLNADSAVDQLHAALTYIYKKNNNNKTDILGWSWGTLVAAKYAIAYPEEVRHLILSAAMYSSSMPEPQQSMTMQGFKNSPNSQAVPWEMIEHHWQQMLSPSAYQQNQKAITAVRQAYCQMEKETKCGVTRLKSQMQDLTNAWSGNPVYDANQIIAPTLLIYGSGDFFSDSQLFEKLTQASYREQVVVKDASHWLLYEDNRTIFYKSIINFLKT